MKLIFFVVFALLFSSLYIPGYVIYIIYLTGTISGALSALNDNVVIVLTGIWALSMFAVYKFLRVRRYVDALFMWAVPGIALLAYAWYTEPAFSTL